VSEVQRGRVLAVARAALVGVKWKDGLGSGK